MYKKKKIYILLLTFIYSLLSIIEIVKYFLTDSNIFGLFYLLITLFNIFLLIPICSNYKKYYSGIRISKLVLIVINGIFMSFFLEMSIRNVIIYTDSSNEYIKKIYIIKNILKPIIYVLLVIFTISELKLEKIIKRKKQFKKSE